MTISPEWIVIATISAIFILGFMIGYTLARLEANKMFDLRDKVMQFEKSRDYWQESSENLNKINKELHEEIYRLKSKED